VGEEHAEVSMLALKIGVQHVAAKRRFGGVHGVECRRTVGGQVTGSNVPGATAPLSAFRFVGSS